MNKKMKILLILAPLVALFISGCATTQSPGTDIKTTFKSFKDYPDHIFDAKEYYAGMKKGGHNLLIWQDPSVDLSKYKSVNITYFDGRLLPQQNKFSYSPFIKRFNFDLKYAFRIPKNDPKGLRIEGAIVECDPGNQAARMIIGMGAGGVACGVVCEVYEPGASKPVIMIYTRDTARSAINAAQMLNHIFKMLAARLSTKIEEKVGM